MTIAFETQTSGDHRRFAFLGYGAVALVFGGFGLWASLAPLDSAAIAPARVAVEGERKPVQHLEGGIVREILVRDAQHVEEGEVLFRLDPTSARANADLIGKQYDAALALEARLIAERNGDQTIPFPEVLTSRAERPEVATVMAEQQRLLGERLRSMANQVGILETRIEQTGNDLEGKTRRLAALQIQLKSFTAEMDAVQPLVDRGLFARNKFRALERERSRIDGEIGGLEGDMARQHQVIAESRLQIRQTRQRGQEELTQTLTEARAKLSDLRERRAVAQDVLGRVDVRAPRSGVVLNVKVPSLGAVVSPGSTLAEVVPPMQNLVLSARVSPLNIQSVAAGQKAEIRFPAFSRKTDPLFGVVETVSADAVQDPTTRETFYQARVTIDAAALPRDLMAKILPGMPADVLIITGERTMLTYLIGPMRDSLAKAMRDQ